MKITPQEAARELLMRRKARASLLDYARYIDIPGAPVSDDDDEWLFNPVETGMAKHHALILTAIEKVMTGKLPRLMTFLPPGSAKSTYGSVVAPSWLMGTQPGSKIILTSYNSDLAKKHGRRARQICKSPKYAALFATEISKETSAADFWTLGNGSEYMSGGILAGITGNRAHGLLIDDPTRGRRDADSETVQKATWEAYQDDLRTRLIPGGWEIIIQTRWSENDISSKILPENYDGETGLIHCRDGRDWYVICIPAQHLSEYPEDPVGRSPGEYLWPEWFTKEHFEGFQATPRTWNSLFQQRPTADEGDFFRRDWFRRYRVGGQPERLHIYMSSDHAPAGEEDSDFNCFRVWGVDSQYQIWMLDGFRTQETMDTATDKALALIKKWRPFAWFPEDDNNWKAVAGFVRREMIRNRTHCRIEPISPHGSDKPTKAQAFQGMASMGMVFLPEGPEGDAVISQYIKFPAGKYDDEVDAAAIIGRAIDMAHPAIAEKPAEPVQTIAQEDWNKVLAKPKGKAKMMREAAW